MTVLDSPPAADSARHPLPGASEALVQLLCAPRARRCRRGLSLGSALLLALRSLLQNGTRTALAMLGIVIGVGCVITMMALGEGTRVATEEQIRSRGSYLLSVRPAEERQGAVRLGKGSSLSLTLGDVAAVTRIPAVQRVAPRVDRSQRVKFRRENEVIEVMGITPEYFEIRNYSLETGRVFGGSEMKSLARVCVIGPAAVKELFGRHDPLGEQLWIRGQPYAVIGILKPRNPDFDQRIWVPVTTAMRRLFRSDYIDRIDVQARDEASMDLAASQAEVVLRKRHRIPEGEPADFEIFNQQDLLEAAEETTSAIRALLVGIASVSLVVGGIGIMNIMLVSVTARTREIGIRRAVGARMADVVSQFLVESVVMCFLGSVIGILVGLGGCWAGATCGQWPIAVTGTSLVVSCAVAASVGLFFGLYPAIRAARVSPLTALRCQ